MSDRFQQQTDCTLSKTSTSVLLSRKDLLRRWNAGSDSFFQRAERDGLLVAGRNGNRTGYAWADIWAFEGGMPPLGLEEAYRQDLLSAEDVSAMCPLGPETILKRAREGSLPFRRIGRTTRFVPFEVTRWLEAWV